MQKTPSDVIGDVFWDEKKTSLSPKTAEKHLEMKKHISWESVR